MKGRTTGTCGGRQERARITGLPRPPRNLVSCLMRLCCLRRTGPSNVTCCRRLPPDQTRRQTSCCSRTAARQPASLIRARPAACNTITHHASQSVPDSVLVKLCTSFTLGSGTRGLIQVSALPF